MSARISEGLKAARDLIGKGWTQRTYARDADGCPVIEWNSEATCFCALGAISRVANREDLANYSEMEHALHEALPAGFPSIDRFNDAPGRTQAEVVDLFNTAISNLEKAA